MILGRVNASARKIVSGCWRITSRSPSPRTGTAWCAGYRPGRSWTPWPIQNRKTSRSSCVKGFPVVALEVDRVDVLVLFGRILGVLDRPVGPMPEPLGMSLHVRVIGRALKRDVERDLQVERLCLRHELASKSPTSRGRGGLPCAPPPCCRSPRGYRDRPGPRGQGVVRPLAEGGTDRVNRREVDDVEIHARDIVEVIGGGGERAVLAGFLAVDRGKNSYHAPYRARTARRPTSSVSVVGLHPRERSGWRFIDVEQLGAGPGGDPLGHVRPVSSDFGLFR